MVLEEGIVTDYALVRAAVADKAGNCRFHAAARNFNPPAAMSGRITIVEAERVVEVGELHPDDIHLPGIFVKRIVALTPEQAARKDIEKRTTRRSEREHDELDPRQMAARAAARAARRRLRQPRHRPAHADPGPPSRVAPTSPCTPRTASSGWARSPTRTRSTPI